MSQQLNSEQVQPGRDAFAIAEALDRVDASAPILYDADAEQHIPVMKEFEDSVVKIVYIVGPQEHQALVEYDRLCGVRLESIDAKDAGERNVMAQKDQGRHAAIWLFNDRAVSVEGFGEESSELPPNWLELIDDRDKVAVIDQAYLATGDVPKAPAKPGTRIPWDYKTRAAVKTIMLRALFNGYECLLTHRRSSAVRAEQMAEFDSLRKQAAIVGGTRFGKSELLILPKAERFGALYDSLGYEAEGYAGRVPLHHKRKVVELDLAGDAEVIAKKWGDSPS